MATKGIIVTILAAIAVGCAANPVQNAPAHLSKAGTSRPLAAASASPPPPSVPITVNVYYKFPSPNRGFVQYDLSQHILDLPYLPVIYLYTLGFNFTSGAVGIVGLSTDSPYPTGGHGAAAVFTTWTPGAVAYKGPCVKTGDVLNCVLSYSWTAGHVYDYEVILVRTTPTTRIWAGWIIDKTNVTSQEIAEWQVPRSWGLLTAASAVVQDWAQLPSCKTESYSKVQYGSVTGTLSVCTQLGSTVSS